MNGALKTVLKLSIVAGWILISAWAAVRPAEAHAFAPALLEVRQLEPEVFTVRFKQPATRRAGSELRPVLPESCRDVAPAEVVPEGTGWVVERRVRCEGGLVGRTVTVEGIGGSGADVLLCFEPADGPSVRHVLTVDAPAFELPAKETRWDVFRGYGSLGIEHIVFGFDHLLFVLGLVLLVRGGRALLTTVTAFTVGHSVTLALASLGLVHLPSKPTEALIALSIFALAVELAGRAGVAGASGGSFLGRRPGWVAGGFGLLHGLGFAGALSEIGLPQGEIPAALFAFNLGIEAGQLLFVGVAVALGAALRRAWGEVPRAVALLPVYGIGSLAAYWTLERLMGI